MTKSESSSKGCTQGFKHACGLLQLLQKAVATEAQKRGINGLQVDNDTLEDFAREARRSGDAAATPKERFGIARKRSRRRTRPPKSQRGRNPTGGSPTDEPSRADTGAIPRRGSRGGSGGDPSLPSHMTGKLQVREPLRGERVLFALNFRVLVLQVLQSTEDRKGNLQLSCHLLLVLVLGQSFILL